MQDWDYETYTNTEVVAIDQDPLGVQGTVIWENCQSYSGVPPCQQVQHFTNVRIAMNP